MMDRLRSKLAPLAPADRWVAVCALVVGFLLFAPVQKAEAVDIQRVISPGGIEAWLVEDHNNPLIAINFAIKGGRSSDPSDKYGVSAMMASLLTEGAGDLDSQAFKLRIEETAVRLSFSANVDTFRGSMQTLTTRLDDAAELMELALTAPRFDEEPLERLRNQALIGLKRDETNPDALSSKALMTALFGDHPYGQRLNGTEETISGFDREDLAEAHERLVVRDRMKIGVVGDIDAATLGPLLDQIFGDLPVGGEIGTLQEATVGGAGLVEVIDLEVPQSSIQFAMPGLKRDDEDFITAFVVNFVFGGGSFSSRLYEEVREKRGLVYSVYAYLNPFDYGAVLIGGAGTQNARVQETISVIRDEIDKIGREGITEAELDKAKAYLTGSYPLRFDTSSKIARQLVGIQIDDLGIDYFDKRNDLVRAVTLEDANRVAQEIYDPAKLAIVVTGQPENVDPKPAGG